MKIKKLFAVSAAAAIFMGFSACSDNNNTTEEASLSTEINTSENSDENATNTTASSEYTLKQTNREHNGIYIANGMTTGVNVYAPEGLTDITYSATKAEILSETTYMPECVPTSNSPFSIESADTEDVMIFYAGSGPSQNEFKEITKEEVKQNLLYDWSKYNLEAEVTEFETFEIENYPAYKAVFNVTNDGYKSVVPYEMTIVRVDIAEFGCQSGYEYTFTYFDYSGNLKDKIQDSIDSIDPCNALNLWRTYPDPNDAAIAQKNGETVMSGNTTPTAKTTAAVTSSQETSTATVTTAITQNEKVESIKKYIDDLKTTKTTIDNDLLQTFQDVYN